MAKFNITASYHAGTSSVIDLPFESWDEVKDFYVKWDTLHYCLKSDPDVWREVELDSATDDIVDWKRPSSVEIYATEDGDAYAESVADY